ncbi:LOW QUALITY PROTEIN: hypothetical protein HZS_7455 [Henneguya salminicola]|nr:LOW QUALITY PROTEIN: hypothetical protein HZS_7455 [Henneguya salminicola]
MNLKIPTEENHSRLQIFCLNQENELLYSPPEEIKIIYLKHIFRGYLQNCPSNFFTIIYRPCDEFYNYCSLRLFHNVTRKKGSI